MAEFDVAKILPTVQQNALATQTQARAQQQQAQNKAVVTGQPTFWGRIQQVGIGQVNLLNAVKAAKSVGRAGTAALGESVEAAARVLPGGQNDLKAQQDALTSSAKSTKTIQDLEKSGKISSPQAAILYKNQAKNDNQASQQAHATVEASSEANQSKQGVQMLEATPRAVANVGEKVVQQAKYLSGPNRTEQGQAGGNQIIKNQTAAAKNPQYQQAIKSLKDKGVGTNAIITAQDMASKGAGSKQITDYLTKQATGLENQTNQGLSDMAQIVSVIAGGGELVNMAGKVADKVTGKAASEELATNIKTNKLVQAGAKANTRDVNIGKKAVTGRQITPEPSETKLLGPGSGKVTGKGFTASPTTDVAKVKVAARLNTINKKLSDFAQGKITIAPEDVKALKAEKDNIYKQARTSTSSLSEKVHDATVKNGGVSLNPKGESPPKDSIIYSPSKSTETVIPADKYTPADDAAFMQKYATELKKPGNYMGTYHDDDGNVVLDVSKAGPHSADTIKAAQAARQDAVWDNQHNELIPTGQTDEKGVYSPHDTPSSIFAQHHGQDNGTVAPGNSGGAAEVSKDIQQTRSQTGSETSSSFEANSKLTGRQVSGSVLKSESRAVEKGLVDEFEDKAGYKQTSYKADAESAVTLAHENPNKAMDIATGKKSGTSPSHEVAVRRAVETKALNEGDTETLQKLAASPLHSATSEAAQRLGAEAYNADSSSPVDAMRHVAAARTAAMEKKLGSSVPKAVNDTAKEIASHEKSPSKFEWQSFVESIKC